MKHHAGLGVSLEETAIRIVDDAGGIVRELRAPSEPEALAQALEAADVPLERVGLEACSLAARLHDGLREAGWSAVCIETRTANAAMNTMPNKTDGNDARALAQIMRTGWFRQVHVKSRQARLQRSLLGSRRSLLNEMRSLENVVRAVLREAGLKLGRPARTRFEARVRELAGDDAAVMAIVAPLLAVLRTMRAQPEAPTRRILAITREDATCRRTDGAPASGPDGRRRRGTSRSGSDRRRWRGRRAR